MSQPTILILGLGVVGKSLAAHFSQNQAQVWGLDDGDLQKLTGHPDFHRLSAPADFKDWERVDRFFVSPGVPLDHSSIKQAQAAGLAIENELDLAFQRQKKINPSAQIIGITGTNGKSTTTCLIGQLFKKAGYQTAVGGNLGRPFLDLLKEQPKADFYILELSSFQLALSQDFHPQGAVFLNLSEDHLDRHPKFQDYQRAKEKLFQNMQEQDTVFYNDDDLPVLESVAALKTQKIPFSTAKKVPGAWADNHQLAWSPQTEILSSWPQSQCALQGLHNLENMAASLAVAKHWKISDETIGEVFKNFTPLAHRMTLAGVVDGVAYYNDSKATNVGAAAMSLASFEKNVLLIMGGVDKGGSYQPLQALIRAKVKALITLGQAGAKIAKALKKATKVHPVQNMQEALTLAKKISQPGDTVLLAPACSSFDQYKNYAERGRDFEEKVQLAANEK